MANEVTDREEAVEISVVIPAYNAEATLERAAASVLSQTFKALELIIVDDGSFDKTAEIADELAKRDSRVHVLHKKNGGVSAARNDGIRRSRGQWLVTLDDDDYLDQKMLERLYTAAVSGNAQLALCGIRLIYPDRSPAVFRPETEVTADRETFLNVLFTDLYDAHLISTHSNKLYSLPVLKQYGIQYAESLSINEDLLFCLQYIRCCESIAVIRGVYMNYVQHGVGESLITTFSEAGLWSCFPVLKAYDALFDSAQMEDEPVNAMNNRMIMHICSFLGLMYYRSDFSREKERSIVCELCAREEFQRLLRQTSPQGLKAKAACFLLRHRMSAAYDALCRLLYLGKRRRERRTGMAKMPGANNMETEK